MLFPVNSLSNSQALLTFYGERKTSFFSSIFQKKKSKCREAFFVFEMIFFKLLPFRNTKSYFSEEKMKAIAFFGSGYVTE